MQEATTAVADEPVVFTNIDKELNRVFMIAINSAFPGVDCDGADVKPNTVCVSMVARM